MTLWRSLADSVLTALAAPACAACHHLLEAPLDGAVCAACWHRVRPLVPPLCRTCGDPLPSWRVASIQAGLCARCRRTTPLIARGRAVGAYEGALREIVHALKYDGRRSIGRPLARLIADHAADILHGADAVVPVPLHPRRERQRGFNQSDVLARALGPPVLPALRRVQATRPQVDLPSALRHRNVRDAFALRRADVSGRILVLVDDVATTGATLEACARVLKAAGVREVRAVTAARVVSLRR